MIPLVGGTHPTGAREFRRAGEAGHAAGEIPEKLIELPGCVRRAVFLTTVVLVGGNAADANPLGGTPRNASDINDVQNRADVPCEERE